MIDDDNEKLTSDQVVERLLALEVDNKEDINTAILLLARYSTDLQGSQSDMKEADAFLEKKPQKSNVFFTILKLKAFEYAFQHEEDTLKPQYEKKDEFLQAQTSLTLLIVPLIGKLDEKISTPLNVLGSSIFLVLNLLSKNIVEQNTLENIFKTTEAVFQNETQTSLNFLNELCAAIQTIPVNENNAQDLLTLLNELYDTIKTIPVKEENAQDLLRLLNEFCVAAKSIYMPEGNVANKAIAKQYKHIISTSHRTAEQVLLKAGWLNSLSHVKLTQMNAYKNVKDPQAVKASLEEVKQMSFITAHSEEALAYLGDKTAKLAMVSRKGIFCLSKEGFNTKKRTSIEKTIDKAVEALDALEALSVKHHQSK